MLIIVVSHSSYTIATFSARSVLLSAIWLIQNTLVFYSWKAQWLVCFWNMFEFPAVSSRFVQTNKHLHLRLFPTTKGQSFWMWSLCFLFDPSYLLHRWHVAVAVPGLELPSPLIQQFLVYILGPHQPITVFWFLPPFIYHTLTKAAKQHWNSATLHSS